MKIKPGGARIGAEFLQTYIEHLGAGLVPTDGVQYSPVATFGTTAVEILNQLIDPGLNFYLKELEVGLTQRFDNLKADSVGSLIYHWKLRPEYVNPQGTKIIGDYINITGTYSKGMPTSGLAGDPAEDTFSGYVPVGSVQAAPVRAVLTAIGLVADSMTGEVKNSSYIRLIGAVIPGA